MKRTSKSRSQQIAHRRPAFHRPHFEILEDRLPLGDALGGLLGSTLLLAHASAARIIDAHGVSHNHAQLPGGGSSRREVDRTPSVLSLSTISLAQYGNPPDQREGGTGLSQVAAPSTREHHDSALRVRATFAGNGLERDPLADAMALGRELLDNLLEGEFSQRLPRHAVGSAAGATELAERPAAPAAETAAGAGRPGAVTYAAGADSRGDSLPSRPNGESAALEALLSSASVAPFPTLSGPGAGRVAGGVSSSASSFVGLDLETVYLGFNPALPGSAAQLDLRVQDELLRLTAWAPQPGNRFEDFHIDIDVNQAQLWNRFTTVDSGGQVVSDRIVFRYVDIPKNIRVEGNFLLAPHWRGVLDTVPIDPRMPMDNMPTLGRVRWLMVRAPLVHELSLSTPGRAMPYGVFQTVTPTISVPIDVVTSSQGRVFLDDGWDETDDSTEITSQFVPMKEIAQAVATGVQFLHGSNRLTFEFPAGAFEVFSQNYDNDTVALVEEQAGNEDSDYFEATDTGQQLAVLKNGIGIFVPEDQPEAVTSSFFRIFRFRPIGYARAFLYYQALVHGQNLSDDEDANGITDVLEYPDQEPGSDNRQAHLTAEVAFEPLASSELIPTAIANNSPTRGYNVETHGWNDPALVVSGLDLAREHFWMDTFAGHRLSDAFVASRFEGAPPPNNPVIGIVDTGFGSGAVFPNADFPVGAFHDLWVVPEDGARDSRPQRINGDRDNRVPVTATHLQNDKIRDRASGTFVAGGHGTLVAHLAAGRGASLKLGTGKDALISVYRVPGLTVSDALGFINASLAQLIQEPQVRVLNFSLGRTLKNVSQATKENVFQAMERAFDRLSREGIICVIAAGNSQEGPAEVAPGNVAPARGARQNASADNLDGVSPLAMRVSAFRVPTGPQGQEEFWPQSGRGNNISVAAPGADVFSVNKAGGAAEENGTSLAAPYVSGLVAEVVRILDLSQGLAAPTTLQERRARVASARRAIEIVEATADRLNRNIAADFDTPEPGPSDMQGFGRVNVWKAVLTAINGGLAAGGAVPEQFQTLPTISAANTTHYGFLIRLQSNALTAADRFSNAAAWINNNPYDDVFNPVVINPASQLRDPGANTGFTMADGGPTVHNVIAYKRQSNLNSRMPVGFRTAGPGATGTGVQEMIFSARIEELAPINGNPAARLELRRNEALDVFPPFFSILLDFNALRNNAEGGGGNGTNIRFDDYVLEILVDHAVLLNRNEVIIPPGAGALPAADEVELAVTVLNQSDNTVAAVPVTFSVVDTNGNVDTTTQIRMRNNQGVGDAVANLGVQTDANGVAKVFVTRIAGAGGEEGVTSRIRVDVSIGQQFMQNYTVPTRKPLN